MYIDPTGKKFAAKVFHKEFSVTSPQREIKIVSNLKHQNIVCYEGDHYCIPRHRPILLMELMTTNLSEHIKEREDISESENLRIAHNITCGLDYLHTHTPMIIHRDIKAENILLDEKRVAKIGDFSNSRFYSREQVSSMTKCGGSMLYMAPELIYDSHYDEKVDIFSCGHLMLGLFINRFTIDIVRSSTEVGKRKVCLDELKRICVVPIVTIIEKCLSETSKERPSSTELYKFVGTLHMENII